MANPVYAVTYTKDFNGYQAGESAAFSAAKCAELFVLGIGDLSADDQATLSSEIAAAKMAHPQKPVAVTTYSMPDGTIRLVASPGQPNYGKD